MLESVSNLFISLSSINDLIIEHRLSIEKYLKAIVLDLVGTGVGEFDRSTVGICYGWLRKGFLKNAICIDEDSRAGFVVV